MEFSSLVSDQLKFAWLQEADSCKPLAIVSTAFSVPEVIAGNGQHMYHLSPHQLSEALKWNWNAILLPVLNFAANRISICVCCFFEC